MSEIQGINSVEIAVSVLEAIAQRAGPVRATDIAKALGMSKNRLHKYLVSLCRSGLLRQEADTALYTLGPKLLVLSEAAERQNDILTRVNDALCGFRDRLNISTGLALRRGGNIRLIRYNRSNRDIEIDYRDDSILPLYNSAAGKIYQVFLEELQESNRIGEEERRCILERGYAARLTETADIPGAKAISCPIFSPGGRLVGAAVAMGFLSDSVQEQDRLGRQLIAAVTEATKQP